MTIIGFLITLILVGLCFWAVRAIVAAFKIPPPIVTVIYVMMTIAVVLWLLQGFGMVQGPFMRWR